MARLIAAAAIYVLYFTVEIKYVFEDSIIEAGSVIKATC
jgi:hypothetical protein